MMNESIIYGLIIGAFSLIDLFQHNSYHVALKDRPARSVLYRSEYVVVYMVIGLLEHDLI